MAKQKEKNKQGNEGEAGYIIVADNDRWVGCEYNSSIEDAEKELDNIIANRKDYEALDHAYELFIFKTTGAPVIRKKLPINK